MEGLIDNSICGGFLLLVKADVSVVIDMKVDGHLILGYSQDVNNKVADGDVSFNAF